MKNVLITGAGGFIGSHLTEECVKRGFKVKAFIHYNSMNEWGWLDNSPVKNEIEVVLGDVRDFDSVYAATQGCDSVFHLAALIGIPYSYVSPLAYVRTNVEGTYNVLQSARMQNLANVIVTSTSETYGTAQYVPIDEKHAVVGQSPYSASKIGADQLAVSYHRSFEIPVKIVRPFNTYGPRQSARAIIPTIMTQILSGHKEIKLGNLAPTRDLTFVKDTVAGFLAVAGSANCNGEIVNVGSAQEISVGDLAKSIATVMGADCEIVQDDQRVRPDNSEVERLFCDNAKIQKLVDWTPQYSLKEGLKETADWISENLALFKVEQYNI